MFELVKPKLDLTLTCLLNRQTETNFFQNFLKSKLKKINKKKTRNNCKKRNGMHYKQKDLDPDPPWPTSQKVELDQMLHVFNILRERERVITNE